MLTFTYQSLVSPTNDTKYIRLLTLLPGEVGSRISCTIENVELHSSLKYEALSYVWGDSAIRRPIDVNGKELFVTANLETALRYIRDLQDPIFIRDSTIDRVLWVDAICVDQSNLVERSEQVQLMARLYQDALRVIVWLGEEDTHTSIAFRTAKRIAAHLIQNSTKFRLLGLGIDEAALMAIFYDMQSLTESGFLECKHTPGDITQADCIALEEVFQKRTWWSRRWIIQEIAFANTVLTILMCGRQTISWNLLRTLHLLLKSGKEFQGPTHSPESRDGDASHSVGYSGNAIEDNALQAILRPLQALKYLSKLSFAMYFERLTKENPIAASLVGTAPKVGSHMNLVLEFSKDHNCFDPRDIIYAILSLVSSPANAIVPDYTKPITAVFADAVCAIIEQSKDLRFLYGIESRRGTQKDINWNNVPSWIPDFSCKSYDTFCLPSYRGYYNANRGLDFNVTATISTLFPNTLRLSGLLWDTIEKITPPIRNSSVSLREMVLDILNGPSARCSKYATGEPLDAALISTLLRGGIRKSAADDTATKITQSDFEDWIPRLNAWLQGTDASPGFLSLLEKVSYSLANFRICTTRNGYMGLVLGDVVIGDCIAIVSGSNLPLIIRRSSSTVLPLVEATLVPKLGHYILVGTAYVQGVMNGEALDIARESGIGVESILLI